MGFHRTNQGRRASEPLRKLDGYCVALLSVFALSPIACAPRGIQNPAPTEHRLDHDAEARNKSARKEYFERMHRTAPGVDWRAIERTNGLRAMARKEAAIVASKEGSDPGAQAHFRVDGTRTVSSGRTEANEVILELNGPRAAETVTYLGHAFDGPWVTNQRGIGILVFDRIAVASGP